MDPMEGKIRARTEPAKSTLRLRCPECFKLYSIDPLDINESRPKFDCTSCQTRFWISYPECLEATDGVIGFPIDWLEEKGASQHSPSYELEDKPFECPKCTEPYGPGQTECFNCGVIFAKVLEAPSQSATGASRELKDLWEDVINKYDDERLHQDFIEACKNEDSLSYATEKYQGILEACAEDQQASQATSQIEALAEAQLQATATRPVIHEPSVSVFQRLRISAILIFVCGILIAAGYLLPGFRNLMGLGVSGLFFIIAMRYYFRTR